MTADLRTVTSIWMGLTTVREALAGDKVMLTGDKVMLTGDRQLASDIQTWLGLSRFAREAKLARA